LQAISDWRLLLDGEPPAKARSGKLAWIVAATLAIVAAVAFWAPWRVEKQTDRPLVRLDVDLGSDVSLGPAGPLSTVVISPDGAALAYRSGAPAGLFTRRLDQGTATELPGAQGASAPFFSPDVAVDWILLLWQAPEQDLGDWWRGGPARERRRLKLRRRKLETVAFS